jgi:DNA-binding transcriptional regulator GbsR (MarR family)
MSDVMREVLDSLAKMGKQWGLEAPVGRVWGFLLFNSRPVTQREIEEGTGYSRGLISRSLSRLKSINMITVATGGRESRYSVNTSLIKGFSAFLKSFLEDNVKPMIELLSVNLDKNEDVVVRKSFHELISEYKKLYLAIHILARMIDEITSAGTLLVDIENLDVVEVAKKISIRYGITEREAMKNGVWK